MKIVDTQTLKLTSLSALLRKAGRIGNPNTIPSKEMLDSIGGALLDESATGEIPTSDVVFNADTQTYQQVFRSKTVAEKASAAKASCSSRIHAVANSVTQANLSANSAAGLFTAEQQATYISGVQWIAQMIANCTNIVANDLDPSVDANWPALPVGVQELADAY